MKIGFYWCGYARPQSDKDFLCWITSSNHRKPGYMPPLNFPLLRVKSQTSNGLLCLNPSDRQFTVCLLYSADKSSPAQTVKMRLHSSVYWSDRDWDGTGKCVWKQILGWNWSCNCWLAGWLTDRQTGTQRVSVVRGCLQTNRCSFD